MQKLTIDWVKNNGLLVFEVISGSRSYGLDTESSDTDIRGVFILPKDIFYSLDYTPQVSNESNDIVYYELRRFVELLAKNNPNILEMLNTSVACVLQRHVIMDNLTPDMFLSKLCEKSFANYAYTQIKKAQGLEKKIVNPVDEKRKSVLDFCFVYNGSETIALNNYLKDRGWDQSQVGLSGVPHLKDCYNLYYSAEGKYFGIMRSETSNDVSISSIPKSETSVGLLYFNKDGYSVYCKKYKEYWDWVAKRNEERYNINMTHGKNYDAKNMMHVFRLLLMAKEIATEGRINVFRKDREFLLNIKHGKYEYDDLVQKADLLKDELPALYEKADLPAEPDLNLINERLIQMRAKYYDEHI